MSDTAEQTAEWVIRIVGTPVELWFDPANVDDGIWVIDYDPDAEHWTMANQRAQARRFPSAAAALEYWRQQSTVQPLRPDGKPNRPLTAFTISADRVSA